MLSCSCPSIQHTLSEPLVIRVTRKLGNTFSSFVFANDRVKSVLSVTERGETRVESSSSDGNVTHDISSSSHSDDPSVSPWPISGWKSSADVSASSSNLSLSMPDVVEYFLARRSSDGLPQGDCRNLGDELYALYKRGYATNGEVAESDGLLHLSFVFRATMNAQTYTVRVPLDKGKKGTFSHILYCVCTCPGGAKPSTCKHSAGVCNGLVDYSTTGVFVGCTSSTSSLCQSNIHQKGPSVAWTLNIFLQ